MAARLMGKSSLVTGAGAGIGKAVAEAMAREGAAVCLVDVNALAVAEAAAQLTESGHQAFAVAADLRNPQAVADAVAAAAAAHGGVNIVANVAGVVRYGEAPDFEVEDWDYVLDINLRAAFLTTKYAVPHMRAHGGGAIVNCASVQAFTTQREVGAYAASKGGLVSLTKALAIDHARDGIRVNAVAPGSVRTPMLREAATLFEPHTDPDNTMEAWGAAHPLGFLIEPSDVADAFVFLAGPEARAVTGITVAVDAGLLLQLGV